CHGGAPRTAFWRQRGAHLGDGSGQSAARDLTARNDRLMGHNLKQIALAQGRALYEPGQPIDQIYFPQSGMISLLVVAKDGGAVETATIGREGAVGLHGALGKRVSFTRATTQISG